MSYTMLSNDAIKKLKEDNSLEGAALSFIRELCEELRFDKSKATSISGDNLDYSGTSLKANQIPYNMEKDIDRLCFENAVDRFLKSGKKEDAFDVYFCYLEMFIGDYQKTRRMIELLSEYEANGSGLLMKHRDHYSHSVYVFVLGLAIYKSNEIYRKAYKKHYNLSDEKDAAAHYLQYWGLTSLFHDIGYPFELPFEQVCSYFEVEGDDRTNRPFVAYHDLEGFITLNMIDEISEKDENDKKKNEKIRTINEIHKQIKDKLSEIAPNRSFNTINEVFAYILSHKMGAEYSFTEEQMLQYLKDKPSEPNKFDHFMDHAYFSATILFKKLFEEMGLTIQAEYLDALTAILMHNSLYKFCIANPEFDSDGKKKSYKKKGNKPFKIELHPLAYMLMLCDELQCWDRTAYGRNTKKELHPMGCTFDFSCNSIKAVYLFDEKEVAKVDYFKDQYIKWLQSPGKEELSVPELKAYSEMYIKKDGISKFQKDIERIVDMNGIYLNVDTGLAENIHSSNLGYLSDSNFINLYNFAIVLNGRYGNEDWKKAKNAGQEEQYLNNSEVIEDHIEKFKKLSLEYKLSNINQAKGFAKYLNLIGCFYSDKPVDFELVDEFTDEELVKMGKSEHQRWLQEHYDMGWTYGKPEKDKRDFERKHWDMIPDFSGFDVSDEAAEQNYIRLDKAEQDKDTDPMECMLALLKMFDGLRIYRIS